MYGGLFNYINELTAVNLATMVIGMIQLLKSKLLFCVNLMEDDKTLLNHTKTYRNHGIDVGLVTLLLER